VGQSAGSALVSCHLTRPQSWPFFSAAGLESGAYYTGPTVAGAEPQFRALLEYLGCPASNASQGVECLVNRPTSALVAANEYFRSHHPSVGLGGGYGWRPVIDGAEMTDMVPTLAYKAAHHLSGGQLAPVPILIGSTREDLGGVDGAAVPPAPPDTPPAPPPCAPTECNEADFQGWGRSLGFDPPTLARFVSVYDNNESGHPAEPVGATQWYWAFQHANSDASRACPARRMARWATQAGNKAFLYYWTYVPDSVGMCGHGACHSCEIPFVFHVLSETLAEQRQDPRRNQMINASNPHEVALSTQIAGLWQNMSAYGDPNGNGAILWPAFTMDQNPATMIFGYTQPPAKSAHKYRFEKCNFWDSQFQKLLPHGGGGGGGGGGPCMAALTNSCAGAKRASTGNCYVCTGQHQSSLHAAGCTNTDITDYCSH
jgi:carboxylesterase type B